MESISQSEHFTIITEEHIFSWEKRLIEDNPNIDHLQKQFLNDDSIVNEDLPPLENQRILIGDIERTYFSKSKLIPNFKNICQKLLTFYCISNSIQYIQGMSEILGTFILLKVNINISFSRLYNLFICFIDFFMPNYYSKTDLTALQSSFHLLNLLFKYHEPQLYNLFTKHLITPEVYASSWLLTMFANKWSLNVVYHLWDKLILFGDKIIPHFIILATVLYYKNNYVVINGNKINHIAGYLCQLNVDKVKDIDKIIDLALELNTRTPVSYRILANNLCVFNSTTELVNEIVNGYDAKNNSVMPMLVSELGKFLFPKQIRCFDNKCGAYLNKLSNEGNAFCNYCCFAFMNLSKVIKSYVIVDLRVELNKNENKNICEYLTDVNGIIVRCSKYYNDILNTNTNNETVTNIINQEILECIYNDIINSVNSNNNNDIIINEFNSHIILLTSCPNYYNENKSPINYTQNKITTEQTEITNAYTNNEQLTESQKNQKQTYPLYNNIEHILLSSLIQYLTEIKQMKYISLVYGGYWRLHDLLLKYQLANSVKVHKCELCRRYYRNNPLFERFILKGQFTRNVITYLQNYSNVNLNNIIDNKKYFYCRILLQTWLSKIIRIENNYLVIYAEIDPTNNIYKSEMILSYYDIQEIKQAFSYKKIYIFLKDINTFKCYPQLIIFVFTQQEGKLFYNQITKTLKQFLK